MTTPRIAIVVSQFNQEVTHGLLRGARAYLKENGVTVTDDHVYSAPGAFEIPLIAQKLGRSGKYDGVVCLGCVTKGDTAHFEYISETSGHGLMQATLTTGIPLTFGVLTTYTEQQARVRSQDDKHNKGREAAAACLEALKTLARVG
jgi:6,7-dimethyl-8-ribityllumazine synthase